MAGDEIRDKPDDPPPPVRNSRRLAWLGVAVVAMLLLACLGAAALLTPRLDLVHATLYDACSFRAYQFHWQNRQRQPEPLRYDFTNSPDSVVFVAVWIADGPALNMSRALPLPCPSRAGRHSPNP